MSAALPAPEPRGPLPLLRGAREIFALSFDGLVLGRRTVLMAVLLGLPALFAIALSASCSRLAFPPAISGFDLYGVIVAIYDVRNVLPSVRSLLRERPRRGGGGGAHPHLSADPPRAAGVDPARQVRGLRRHRPRVRVAGHGGHASCFSARRAAPRAWGRQAPVLLQDLGVMALTLVAYGALFTLLGVLLKRPVIAGLLFLYLWELLVYLPGYLPASP